MNDGQGKFQDVSASNGSFCAQAMIGRSLALGDLNNDGALDLVACGTGGPTRMFENAVQPHGHWLRLRLLDQAHGNRDEIGAEATVEAGGKNGGPCYSLPRVIWYQMILRCILDWAKHGCGANNDHMARRNVGGVSGREGGSACHAAQGGGQRSQRGNP